MVNGKPAGRKDDHGKLEWDLVPLQGMQAIIKVLMLGAKKYGPENWRQVDDAQRRYYNAAIRHLVSWKLGEKIDPESGESHLAHAACCLLFLLEIDK